MNTTAKGDRLENKLYEIIKNQIERDDFLHYKKSSLTLYKKRKYYSDDKDGDVVFDIVLEVSNPKQKASQKPHMTIIFECKNYGRPVDISDVQTFFASTQGVIKHTGTVKPVFVTNAGLQSGAFNYLKNKGMGYIALSEDQESNELDWVLQRSVCTYQSNADKEAVINTLHTGKIPPQYQMCCFGKNYFGYNFYLFLEELLDDNQHNKQPKNHQK